MRHLGIDGQTTGDELATVMIARIATDVQSEREKVRGSRF